MKNTLISERITLFGLWLLPVVTAWLFLPQLTNAFGVKHDVSILLSLALVCIWIISRRDFLIPAGLAGYGLLIWMSAILISAANSENSYIATRALLEVVSFVLIAMAIYNFRDIATVQRTLENGIIIAGLGVAIFALKQYFLPEMLDPGFHAQGKMKIYSTLGNSNLAALIILASLPSAAWRAFKGTALSRAGFAALTLVLVCGLAATQARHAFIAVGGMGMVALVWLGSRQLRRNVIGALLIGACIIAVLLIIFPLPSYATHSLKGRWFIWLTSLHMLWDHPLAGVGLNHYAINHMSYQGALFATGQFDAYLDNASVISEGHNDYLNWGATTGVPGLLGFTTLCVGVLWQGWKSAALKQQAPQLYLALTGYFIAMLFVSVTSYTAPALFFFLLLGMALARSEPAAKTWTPRLRGRQFLALCVAALAIVAGYQAWREIQGGLIEARGDKLMEEHDLWLADKEYQQALLWAPHNSELRKKHATALFLTGDSHRSLAELEMAKRGSGDLGIYILEGEILTRLGDFDQATKLYRQIISSFPDMVSPHFVLGQIYLLQGEQDLARAEFRKVLEIQPSPFNLNMTVDKVEMQKRIVRDYLHEGATSQPQAGQSQEDEKTQD